MPNEGLVYVGKSAYFYVQGVDGSGGGGIVWRCGDKC